ncbi:transposase, partial [Rhizorhabdus histidinilytica]|uniref:transposase n=1 Tax=Rhizorhabdus histidinilytica TaxID=439228 RepID=UPI001F45E1CD
MPSKKHRPEEIIGKLREAEVVLAQGATTAEACRRIAVSEQTYYRWRKEYGGLKTDQARRMALLQRLAAVTGRLSLCADQAAAAKWWLSMSMASVSAEGPMP